VGSAIAYLPVPGSSRQGPNTALKGEPDEMVRAGTRIFAERVARAVQRGGVATDFPNAELR
jgi:hypothetical protein